MSDTTLTMTPAVFQYLLDHSVAKNSILQNLRAQTHKMSMHQMQISPEQGQLMQLLVKILQARKTLDLGVFTGYSALCVALALPEEGKVIAIDRNEEWTKIARQFWDTAGVAHKIDLRLGEALPILEKMISNGEGGTFDFIFIDADKMNYKNYYEQALILIRQGGLIVIDNVLWEGKVIDADIQDSNTMAIREFNKMIYQDTRVMLSMLPIGDGITLAVKK